MLFWKPNLKSCFLSLESFSALWALLEELNLLTWIIVSEVVEFIAFNFRTNPFSLWMFTRSDFITREWPGRRFEMGMKAIYGKAPDNFKVNKVVEASTDRASSIPIYLLIRFKRLKKKSVRFTKTEKRGYTKSTTPCDFSSLIGLLALGEMVIELHVEPAHTWWMLRRASITCRNY